MPATSGQTTSLRVGETDLSEAGSPLLPFLSTILRTTRGYFPEGMPLAYLIATVVTGLGILIASHVYMSLPEQVARQSAPLPSPLSPLPSMVGRITGLVDCRWAENPKSEIRNPKQIRNHKSEIINHKSFVALGDRFALSSGLMEITYDTGAKVILQGPVTYEVDVNGGYLAVGKLTGKLEKRGERREERGEIAANHQIPNPKSQVVSPSPLSSLLSPLFVIRTPTATITDLGTEFGVEVQDSGVTDTHLFQGNVEVLASSPGGRPGRPLRWARTNRCGLIARSAGPIVRHVAGTCAPFVREMPQPSRLLFRDNFNNRENADVFLSDDCGLNQCCKTMRQSGLYWPLSYVLGGGCYASIWYMAQVSHSVCPGKLNLFADYGQAGWVALDRGLPRNVAVSVELDPDALRCADKGPSPKTVPGDLTSKSWMALSVRGASPSTATTSCRWLPTPGRCLRCSPTEYGTIAKTASKPATAAFRPRTPIAW